MTPSGSNDVPSENPFAYRITKDGRVLIDREGRTVTVVAGAAAKTLSDKLETADHDGVQQLLARATANYRRGNERRGRPAPRP